MEPKKKLSEIMFEHVCNLIKLIPMYLFFLSIAFFINMQIKVLFPSKGYFLFGIGIIIAYLIRYFVHKILPYVILHILLCPLMLFFGGTILLNGLILFFCLLMYIYAYHFWRSDEVGVVLKLHPAFVIAIFFFYILSLKGDNSPYPTYFFTLSIIFVLACIITNYIIRMEAYILENRDNESISLTKVLFRNTRTGLCMIIILILLALIGNIPAVQELASNIYHAIAELLRKIMSSLTSGLDYSEPMQTMPEPSKQPKLPDVGKPSTFGKVLQFILMFIGYSGLAILAAYLIFKVLRYLLSGTERRPRNKDRDDYEGVKEIRTKLKPTKKSKRRHLRRKGPLDKVRYQYYKTITEYEKTGYHIQEDQAPQERSEEIRNKYNDDLSELTEKYEKVRYTKKS